MLAELNAAGQICWLRAVLDASHVDAKRGLGTGPSAVNRSKPGSKHHLICNGGGIPMAVITTAGNVNDVTQAVALLDAVPPIAGRQGRPRRRFGTVLADKGYDSDPLRRTCQQRRTIPVIARRGTRRITGLGKLRYVVEQTLALLHQWRRLAIRWERRLDIHQGLVTLACTLICWRHLNQPRS